MEASPEPGHDLISFINASPTPFHAVDSVKQRLIRAGFDEIKERDAWSSTCRPGGKYYLTRNTSTILAFAVGKKWRPGNPIAMIGAQTGLRKRRALPLASGDADFQIANSTDSPTLRIKPVSKKQSDGFIQVGVETYGGGLWHTWFDRDLSTAGRVMVKDNQGSFVQKLVRIERPILRIPTLAIHLDRQETFSFNKETQLLPIAGLVAAELNRQERKQDTRPADLNGHGQLDKKTDMATPESESAPFHPLKTPVERHHPYLVELIAGEAGVEPENVVDFEMVLYDTQKSCVGGLNDELVYSARLDNLEMSYCSTMALISSVMSQTSLNDDSSMRLISLFDHEEIGSNTAQGADSNFLPSVLRRLSVLGLDDHQPNNTYYEQSLASSFLISADMAHSVNPNYSGKYESDHKPEMNKGTVIKINANARYATNSPGIVLLQEVARRAKVPLQMFVVRNDSSCGSTIGPMLSAGLGTRTLDLGNAQLSMHSIRETGGLYDVDYAIKLFEGFFEHYPELERNIMID